MSGWEKLAKDIKRFNFIVGLAIILLTAFVMPNEGEGYNIGYKLTGYVFGLWAIYSALVPKGFK